MSEIIVSNEELVKQTLAVLEQFRNKIEDVFYEYKHDDDLDFNLFVDFGQDAMELELALSKIPYTVASQSIRGHVLCGRIVTLTVYNLAVKNGLVEALRKNKWRPNGG